MDDTDTGKAKAGWTPEVLRAWNNALVKTGIEHLNLDMVRQGKRGLKEAATSTLPTVPPKRP